MSQVVWQLRSSADAIPGARARDAQMCFEPKSCQQPPAIPKPISITTSSMFGGMAGNNRNTASLSRSVMYRHRVSPLALFSFFTPVAPCNLCQVGLAHRNQAYVTAFFHCPALVFVTSSIHHAENTSGQPEDPKAPLHALTRSSAQAGVFNQRSLVAHRRQDHALPPECRRSGNPR